MSSTEPTEAERELEQRARNNYLNLLELFMHAGNEKYQAEQLARELNNAYIAAAKRVGAAERDRGWLAASYTPETSGGWSWSWGDYTPEDAAFEAATTIARNMGYEWTGAEGGWRKIGGEGE